MPRSLRSAELVSQPRRSRSRPGTPHVVHPPLGLAEYRREVIRIGDYLGWSEPDVARFAERLTGRSWRDCQAYHHCGRFAKAIRSLKNSLRGPL